MNPNESKIHVRLRAAALAALLAGAIGSVGFTLWAGRHNSSIILPILFTLWVLCPFFALFWAKRAAKRWSIGARATLYCAMLICALGSLAIYAYVVLGPPRPKPASVFLMVPTASLVFVAISVAIAARRR